MSCDPFFSLSPLNPQAYTYDAANPDDPYANASLYATGVFHGAWVPLSMSDQYNNDQSLLYLNPALDTDQAINSLEDDVFRKCAVRTSISASNIGAARQYLLVFRLKIYSGSPIAQFFIGNQFVREEAITQSPYDDVAILLDAPDEAGLHATVRLAAPDNTPNHGFFFMGLTCFLL